ncbi:uncharacterized protein [Anoplolepis gracilipes]|uniref:uncharacterized protein n=1 Tax=Anoplolepis gracilipes TaxID=354296 RepID=UPI003BA00320
MCLSAEPENQYIDWSEAVDDNVDDNRRSVAVAAETNLEGQLARWIERLQQYQFEVVYRKGRIHQNADELSRCPCEGFECNYCKKVELKENLVARIVLEEQNLEEWRNRQMEDPIISIFIQGKESGKRPLREEIAELDISAKIYWSYWDALILQNEKYINQILEEAHDSVSGGHFGINKTLEKIRKRFYWATCKSDVEHWSLTTALHPQSDGQVERQHQTILNYLAKFISENQKDWDNWIPMYLLAYRSSKHEVTGVTPAELYFVRDLRLRIDLLRGIPPNSQNEEIKNSETFSRNDIENLKIGPEVRKGKRQGDLNSEKIITPERRLPYSRFLNCGFP